MHALFLQQLCAVNARSLHGAVLRRLAAVEHGFVFELGGSGRTCELALLGAPGAAWALLGDARSRDLLLGELGRVVPALAAPAPGALEWRGETPAALDALRAWMLRPAQAGPAWLRLQGARLVGMRVRADDRRLWIDFETGGGTAADARLELVAELFDRSPNFVLRDGEGGVVATWRRRRPASDPEPRPPAAAAASREGVSASAPLQVTAEWDDVAQRARPAWDATGLGLAAAAYVELAAAAAAELQRSARRERARRRQRLESRLHRLRDDAERAGRATQLRRHAELLAAYLHRARRGQERLVVDDFDAPGTQVAVDLDPQLTPQQNLDRLFKLARRAERGRSAIEARLRAAEAELEAEARPPLGEEASGAAAWPAVLAANQAAWTAALPPALRRAGRRDLWSPGGPPRAAPQQLDAAAPARGPGRCFALPEGWEIRVGRNNEENDELTHRFAHADDIWLHASGVPGSHVVLRMRGRKENPPREILVVAAAIAARYSQAKHAGTVPVVWTRKRYVRKPRRAAAGTAQCSHEKTLFVKPGLPGPGAGERDDPEPGRSS